MWARTWELYQDVENPGELVEAFGVGSWEEHLEQHRDRPTQYDSDTVTAASSLAESVAVNHLVQVERVPTKNRAPRRPERQSPKGKEIQP